MKSAAEFILVVTTTIVVGFPIFMLVTALAFRPYESLGYNLDHGLLVANNAIFLVTAFSSVYGVRELVRMRRVGKMVSKSPVSEDYVPEEWVKEF